MRLHPFHPGPGYPGYLVLLRIVALLYLRLAGTDRRFEVFLSHGRTGNRIRYHFLLGYPYDFLRLRADGRKTVQDRIVPRTCQGQPGQKDVQVLRKRYRPAGNHRPVRCRRSPSDPDYRQCARQRYAFLL